MYVHQLVCLLNDHKLIFITELPHSDCSIKQNAAKCFKKDTTTVSASLRSTRHTRSLILLKIQLPSIMVRVARLASRILWYVKLGVCEKIGTLIVLPFATIVLDCDDFFQ